MNSTSQVNASEAARAAATANSRDAFVRIENVVKKFGDSTAVNNVSLNIAKNELFALLGSSGCGKSTLLRMLAGLETATSGKIFVDGEDLATLPPYRRP
ncbi:ABC transporter family protein, partial [Paraburkholderia eburnea]